MPPISVLATDMDGTFIPLDGNEENHHDLKRLCAQIEKSRLELLYVTGRHYGLVMQAVHEHDLPNPRWLICDVGTSIYSRSSDEGHILLDEYHAHLGDVVRSFDVSILAERFSGTSDLRIQEEEKQGRFKLSYYCAARRLGELADHLSRALTEMNAPYRIISSVDPFTGECLIDFLPQGVSKDYALRWWVDRCGRHDGSVVFAGDSGNDLAALTAGYRGIVVANADEGVVKDAVAAHQAKGWTGRLFVATKPATSGVLQGLKHFLESDQESKS